MYRTERRLKSEVKMCMLLFSARDSALTKNCLLHTYVGACHCYVNSQAFNLGESI